MAEHRLDRSVIEKPRGGARIPLKKLKGVKKNLAKELEEEYQDAIALLQEEDLKAISRHQPQRLKLRYRSFWGIKKDYLSDHLSPLYGFLDKQVGRPWDQVYSELVQRLGSSNSHSAQHILIHVWQYIEKDIEMIDGIPYNIYTKCPLHIWRGGTALYIHPVTKVLTAYKASYPLK